MTLETTELPELSEGEVRRFWSKVEPSESGCLLWRSTQSRGYGQMSLRGKNRSAHRISYRITFGPIPDGKLVLHSCHTPLCVRPDHLKVGSHQENMRDRKECGNYATGEDHPCAKLTESQVEEMRWAYDGDATTPQLADEYDIDVRQVWQVITGNSWPHAGGPTTNESKRARGENAPTARLTAKQVREIRGRYDADDVTCVDLAEEYPVCSETIRQIVQRETWTHV